VPKPIATWNPARGAWEVPGGASHLRGHSELYSETWPTSGTWDLGNAYAPRTWERPTPASASSSSRGPQTVHRELTGGRLLKTPTSQLAVNGGSQHPDKRRAGGHGPTLADEVEHLLPTPRTSDTNGTGRHGTGGPDLRTGPLLPGAVEKLLPTPMAADSERTSLTMPNGNPTLAGAIDSLGSAPTTPKRSRGGKQPSAGPHPGQLTIADA